MTDGEHIFAHWLLIIAAFVVGFFIGLHQHKRRVLPQPRRMIK